MVTYHPKKLFAGYAGVKWTAKKIMEEIPDMSKYNLYVEPFAGLGRTAVDVKIPMILNDMSEVSNKYCRENFPNATVEQIDFVETINKYDSDKTFFLIDPPWRYDHYNNSGNGAVCDRKPREYYNVLLTLMNGIKGDWFILSAADEHECRGVLTKSRWNTKIVKSDNKPLFGKHARTLICSNLF